ncbi:peptidase domain-containing ABC transporter [Synechococcus sp. AH-736-M20]|nr:peptidase domain-containing ABC transporter [Synechococcus sp. AH-736-M20]
MSVQPGEPSVVNTYYKQLSQLPPFSFLEPEELKSWLSESKLLRAKPGETIISYKSLQDRIYLVVNGQIRMLKINDDGSIDTLAKRGSGQLIGWVSLLRAAPTEWITASEDSVILALPAKYFLASFKKNLKFKNWFGSLVQPQESNAVILASLNKQAKKSEEWKSLITHQVNESVVVTLEEGANFNPPSNQRFKKYNWCVSTTGLQDYPVGSLIKPGSRIYTPEEFNLPLRVIGIPEIHDSDIMSLTDEPNQVASSLGVLPAVSLKELGIVEGDYMQDSEKYPYVSGKGEINEVLAVCEMTALHLKVPFRYDGIKKAIESHFRRDKVLSLELVAALSEGLGLGTQIGFVQNDYIASIEAPALLIIEGSPVILFEVQPDEIILGHPRKGLIRISVKQLKSKLPEEVKFALPRRIASSPTSRFGWSWFTPLIKKYKKSLALVFATSLLAQLFGLAIPLLIQQIIDKVLMQGNMSTLNVIGGVMIILAVFQGCLLALRTYIFVDTTDRMDLTLGSAVIDRMLSLPLSFFEKRPVGELSQRLGELNSIRGFLTGTALVSVLNIIFALLYLVVMIVYSPLLTAVALSTFPIYALLVFGIAPLYRYLIRQRAVAQARTQSHLIEVLGGIQTVKAQHFELTARWKWQDRYRNFVSEGFKAVVLGTTSGTLGSILNQLSSLLVLWVGMYLVLQGDLTLGMLIAFRIIAGNVTGPLMQLSGLYQGFQKVQVSMERLSDILDQSPELNDEQSINQIPMPLLKGAVRFENVKFRFGRSGPYQLNGVSLEVPSGCFAAIVGQSGSGKSTLMKLLPRLYQPNLGNIYVDDYDISKVELGSLRRQIGIVPQDSLLFEGTISDNIALNDPQASADSIIEAAKISCAHDFIMTLPDGYATQLSERGSNLSGGQRQRIAIARTILSNPQLLVMDEATSALDFATERELCLNLQKWAESRTVFFITHRLSSIKNSDTILVMHDGELVEQGTHDELLQLQQRYFALYSQQSD